MTELTNINYSNNMNMQNISRYSEAPSHIYKYSINNRLKEKDEFRKNIKNEIKASKENEKTNDILKKALLIGSAILGFIVLETKKII